LFVLLKSKHNIIVTNENINPLNWWRTHQNEFPTLAKIAKDYLTIQATSIPCEQLFSLANHTIRKTRSRLHPQTARASICLKSWLKYFSEIDNNEIHLDDIQQPSNENEEDTELYWGLIDE